MRIQSGDWHGLTGSYAVDALPEPERADFERHLEHCPSCNAEVRGLRETAARLAMAQALRPPARMEERVLGAAYQVRQLPPLPDSLPDRGRSRHRVARRFAGRPALQRAAAIAAAASVAAAIALGVTQVNTEHQLASARASSAAITRIVTAPDARLERTGTSAGGIVTIVASAALREAVITATGMAGPPPGRVYQVWVMNPSGARSAGLISGRATLLAQVVPGDRIGITIEPAGGTSQPTTTPVVVVPVTT